MLTDKSKISLFVDLQANSKPLRQKSQSEKRVNGSEPVILCYYALGLSNEGTEGR